MQTGERQRGAVPAVDAPASPTGPATNGSGNGAARPPGPDAAAIRPAPAEAAPAARPTEGASAPTRTEEATAPAARPAAPPARPAGAAAAPTMPEPARGVRNLRRLLLIPLALVTLAVAGTLGYRYWYEDTHFVTTENAQVAGALVQFGSLNAGRVSAVHVDVGRRVRADQEVAVVMVPTSLASTPSGAPKLGYVGTDDERVSVRSPSDGVVVARLANPGDTVQAGQAMLAIVDPAQFWIEARIEETKIGRVRLGQSVEVRVDSLGRTFPGRVVAITPATAATFSLIPPQNTTGNFNKITQLIPVKIAIDYGDAPLALGSSVEVKIRVAAGE